MGTPLSAPVMASRRHLERLHRPGCLVGPAGDVLYANEAARLVLEPEGRSLRDLLAAMPLEALDPEAFEVLAIEDGPAPHRTVLDVRHGIQARVFLAKAVRRWNLSPRLALVLSHLVAGAPDADIARALGIRQKTAGKHVSCILERSGCASRTEVVTRVFEDLSLA